MSDTLLVITIVLIGLGALAGVIFLVYRVIIRKPVVDQPKSQRVTLKQLDTLPDDAVLGDLQKTLRNGGIILGIIGLLSIFSGGVLDATFGFLLLVVGLMSFYFKDAAMFAVYGCVLVWAAVWNLISGSGAWIFFALFQGYLAFQDFRRFAIYHRAEMSAAAPPADDPFPEPRPKTRTEQVFPYAAALIGTVALIGIAGLLTAAFVGLVTDERLMTAFDVVINFLVAAAMLGVSFGAASLLAKHRMLPLAAYGMLTGALAVMIVLTISVLL